MKRLPLPGFDTEQTFAACTDSIRDDDFRRRVQLISDKVARYGGFYEAHAQAGVTYAIPVLGDNFYGDPIVFGSVRKSELVGLYDQGMVARRSGRAIYNAIMVSAPLCPTCGELGSSKTLDHYLPKANYPWLSICPSNLIPACRDCNAEKGNPIPKTAFEQLIHPYFDDTCFFDEVWITAEVLRAEPFELRFYPCPPSNWGRLHKKRAARHFDFYDLAAKYSLRSAEELSMIIDQRRGSLRQMRPLDFQEHLAGVGNNEKFIKNHWRRVMYRALAGSFDFCTYDFYNDIYR